MTITRLAFLFIFAAITVWAISVIAQADMTEAERTSIESYVNEHAHAMMAADTFAPFSRIVRIPLIEAECQ